MRTPVKLLVGAVGLAAVYYGFALGSQKPLPPSPKPGPSPTPPGPLPGPPTPPPEPGYTPLQQAAVTMQQALASHGYVLRDQSIYKAFQSAAGKVSDGYPGTGTMSALVQSLPPGVTLPAALPFYPWSSAGGYDGVNAPTLTQWHS